MAPIIRFGEPIASALPVEKLPTEDQLDCPSADRKQLRAASFQVYVASHVIDKVWHHVDETPKLESGGVLVGHAFQCIDDPAITFVIVVDALRQESYNRSIGHYTVGPTEIASVRITIERNYAGLKIVGWYHSHPGHGVFLSQKDMQIVQSIYNAEWHLALVLDTIYKDSAFFCGPQGRRLAGWLSYKAQAISHAYQMPATIRTIDLYNRWLEAKSEGNTNFADENIFPKIQELISHEPELIHWRQRGSYQNDECIIAGLTGATVLSHVDQYNQISEDAMRIYDEALKQLKSHNHDCAIKHFQILVDKYPTFKADEVQEFVKRCKTDDRNPSYRMV